MHMSVVFSYTACTSRNPQATKKSGVQDWRLILFVCILLLLNTAILLLYILLEGVVAHFNVKEIPNKERPSTIQGVRRIITFNWVVIKGIYTF